jgi:hypothetical protein
MMAFRQGHGEVVIARRPRGFHAAQQVEDDLPQRS